LKWVYRDEEDVEDKDDLAEKASLVTRGTEFECAYPLQKDAGEEPDAFLLKDAQNNTLFTVCLVVGEARGALTFVAYHRKQVLLDFIPTTAEDSDATWNDLETTQWALDSEKHILTCHVEAKWQFKIAVVNCSTEKPIEEPIEELHLKWVYENELGVQDADDLAEKASLVTMGGEFECPYALQKDAGEEPDTFLLKDAQNNTLFTVRLVVGELLEEVD
jgi:hypothetical protein